MGMGGTYCLIKCTKYNLLVPRHGNLSQRIPPQIRWADIIGELTEINNVKELHGLLIKGGSYPSMG